MSKTKLIYLPLGILTIVTATSAAILSGLGASAATSATCTNATNDSGKEYVKCAQSVTATVTVSSACSVAKAEGQSHTIELLPGAVTTAANAPTTTITTKCNDGSGFDLYAIGYNDSTSAVSTNLSGTGGNIATGTATSGGTSSWAFKLAAVSGSYTPSITTGYTGWHVVPASQTKVAYRTAATDQSTGSKITATYQIYVANSQAAGTYTGGVKYTVVHPHVSGTTNAPANS